MADQLNMLLDEFDQIPPTALQRTIIYLGDLIDRGPNSLRAIDLAIETQNRRHVDAVIALAGNHENMLRLAISNSHPESVRDNAARIWISNGGITVLNELIDQNHNISNDTSIRIALGEKRISWLNNLNAAHHNGNLTFVHAGIHPEANIEEFLGRPWDIPLTNLREDRHWAWIREPFLNHRPEQPAHGKFIVHGHSIIARTDNTSNTEQISRFRLNLDGGSFINGVIRAALFSQDSVTLYETPQID